MILPPGVRYSIIRNDVEVPLIPADQLPFYIEGLPRQLTPFRRHREGWQSIGETQQPALPLSVCAPSDFQPHQPSLRTSCHFLSPDHDARQDSIATSQALKPIREADPALIASAEGVVDRLISTPPARRPTSMMAENSFISRSEGFQYPPYRLPNPSGIEPDPMKKEYCTHWIRTNSCDFIQQGCKYKHEMPDHKKLRQLGYPEVPKWYRDKLAVSAGVSSWLRPCVTQTDKDRQLSVEPLASRAFRPLALGHSRDRSPARELPVSSVPEADKVAAEMADLIDLKDASMATLSLTPSISVESTSRSTSRDVKAVVAQPSEQVIKTLPSSLRQGESDKKRHMRVSVAINTDTLAPYRAALDRHESDDAPLTTDTGLANDTVDLIDQSMTQSRLTCLIDGEEASKQREMASSAAKWGQLTAKLSTAPGTGYRSIRKPFKAQHKRNPRPRKSTESPAASPALDGLAGSKHATGKKLRG